MLVDRIGRQRYELASVEWVNALRDYLTSELAEVKARGSIKRLDELAVTWSTEFRNPPEHLLRGGRDTIGYFIRIQDDQVEVGDHPLDDADVGTVGDYNTIAAYMLLTSEEAGKWMAEHGAELAASGKFRVFGETSKIHALNTVISIRRDFYNVYTSALTVVRLVVR